MAIRAQHRNVPASEREAGFLVTREGKLGRLERLHTVTRLAAVLQRSACKLAFMHILMAVLTLCLHDFEQRVFVLWPLWQMALLASHSHVFGFKRILCCGMIFYGERRWFETFDIVASRTFTTVCTAAELPLVRILMAIHAFCKLQRGFKISVLMTVRALHFCMFAEQREFCFGVIESF